MNYTTYDPATGELQGHFSTLSSDMLSLAMKDKSYVEGKFDTAKFYLDLTTLQPVAKPRDPSSPYSKYTFDWPSKSWVLDTEATGNLIRQYRNELLGLIDRVNPVWYNALSTEQQQELQQFRQQLLDITQQPGFPATVVWPSKPAWL